jgi:hypothetical protein
MGDNPRWAVALLMLVCACESSTSDGDARMDGGPDSSADVSASPDLGGSPDSPFDVAGPPSEAGSADSGTCEPPATISYAAPGCGAAAVPNCSRPQLDACAALIFYCGCDGRTVTGDCTSSSQPYRFAGACPDGGTPDGP